VDWAELMRWTTFTHSNILCNRHLWYSSSASQSCTEHQSIWTRTFGGN
jgi:hypothetical protein